MPIMKGQCDRNRICLRRLISLSWDFLAVVYTFPADNLNVRSRRVSDNVALTKMLAGKKASVNLGSQEALTISGSSTPKDFVEL